MPDQSGRTPSGHEFVQATPQATYCNRADCRKHYSEPIHHQRGYTCPNGSPCAVCMPDTGPRYSQSHTSGFGGGCYS